MSPVAAPYLHLVMLFQFNCPLVFKPSAITALDCDIFPPHLYSWGLFKAPKPLKCWWMRGVGWERCKGKGGKDWEVLPTWQNTCPRLTPLDLGMTHFRAASSSIRLARSTAQHRHALFLLKSYQQYAHIQFPAVWELGASVAKQLGELWISLLFVLSGLLMIIKSACCSGCCRYYRHTSLLFLVCHRTWLDMSHFEGVKMHQ